MIPQHVSDPVLPPRRKGKHSSFMSFPLAIILIASIAGFPPVSSRLMDLDRILHANNDRIVTCIIVVMPFALIAFALFGLTLMFGPRRGVANNQPKTF